MDRFRKDAFTLIELLVVIAIIGLLIAILLPSLNSARSASKANVCLSNLRQIGMQNSVYLSKYREVFPPVRLKQTPDRRSVMQDYYHKIGREFRRKAPRWQWFLAEEMGPVIDTDKYADEDSFNASMVIDNEYWEDPAMSGFTNDVRNGAYGFNGTYLGNTRLCDRNEDGTDESWVRWTVNVSRIRDPGQTVLVADSRGGSAPHGNHSYWCCDRRRSERGWSEEQAFGPNPSKPLEELGHSPVEARHSGKGNVAFVDGHAESMTLIQLGYQMDPDTAETLNIDDADYDPTKCHNKLWAGTGRDDPPREYIYPD